MASIKRRSDGRYELRFSVNGRRYSVYGNTKKEVREHELEKRKQIADGTISTNSTITVSKYFELWQESRIDRVKGITLFNQRSRFKDIAALIGNTKLCKLDRMRVLDLQNRLYKKNSAVTTNAKITLLSSMCQDAVYNGIISSNPCKYVQPLKKDSKEPARLTIHRALSLKEQSAFFQACRDCNTWYYELYQFLTLTGLRIGEASALRISDIDLNKQCIHVQRTATLSENGEVIYGTPKTQTSKRDIPLTETMMEVLKRQQEKVADRFGKCTPLTLFVSVRGFQVKSAAVDYDIAQICIRAGIDRFTVHGLRDTFATRALESGVEINTLKVLLGHSSLSMTADLYCHVLPETKAKEIGKMIVDF